MRISASQKSLLDTILGTDVEPTTGHNSKGWKAWRARRDAAVQMIVKNLDDSQLTHVHGYEQDPAGMWTRLAAVHVSRGFGGIIGEWKLFYKLEYDGSTSMRAHLGAIRAVAERLGRVYNDSPSDHQIMARMLSSIPTSYNNVISILDATDSSNLMIELVEQKILNEETNLAKEQVNTHNSLALRAQTMRAGGGSGVVDVCENCGGEGHSKARCWHKGGDVEGEYPDWWKGRRDVPMAGFAVARSFVI